MDAMLAAAAQRYMAAGQTPPHKRPWMEGRSALGGTPAKDAPEHMNAVPKAPGVASRTKPGTVPPRKRGYRPEMRNG